jgi:hypothetical protein
MTSTRVPFVSQNDKADAFSGDGNYDEIGDDDVDGILIAERRTRTWWKITTWLFATWGFVSLVFHIFLYISPPKPTTVADVYRPETLSPGLNHCNCGNTVKEALSLNCAYDSLATSWLPPHCRDEELTAEFDVAGPGPHGQWNYFADENGTVSLTKTEISKLGEMGGSFWSSRDWHLAHCVFYWQKYKRMQQTGVVMEARFDSLKHVKHCSRLITKPAPGYFFLIEVPVWMNGSVDEHPRDTKISGKLPHLD